MRLIRVLTFMLLCAALAGCAMASGAATHLAQRQPSPCDARGRGRFSLPDRHCTPGVVARAVTQANIQRTICKPGYSGSVRPPESVTEPQKLASMEAYGDTGSPHGYEYDHLISLELGGAPDDLKNLWPEPGASPNPKDKLENRLHKLVCDGSMTLAAAQREIAGNWVKAYHQMLGTS